MNSDNVGLHLHPDSHPYPLTSSSDWTFPLAVRSCGVCRGKKQTFQCNQIGSEMKWNKKWSETNIHNISSYRYTLHMHTFSLIENFVVRSENVTWCNRMRKSLWLFLPTYRQWKKKYMVKWELKKCKALILLFTFRHRTLYY